MENMRGRYRGSNRSSFAVLLLFNVRGFMSAQESLWMTTCSCKPFKDQGNASHPRIDRQADRWIDR